MKGRRENLNLELRILQIVKELEPYATVSRVYERIKEEFHYKSKGTLVKRLTKLSKCIEKQSRGVYKITEEGLNYLKEQLKAQEWRLEGKIRAYLVEESLPTEELREKMNNFAILLRKMGYSAKGEYRYKFGGRDNLWNPAVCLVGYGPFRIHRKNGGVAGVIPPVVEVHISEVMLLLRARLPKAKPGATNLEDIFSREELVSMLEVRLDATWWELQTKLYMIFGKKLKLKPLRIDKWIKPIRVVVEEDKLGLAAPPPRL